MHNDMLVASWTFLPSVVIYTMDILHKIGIGIVDNMGYTQAHDTLSHHIVSNIDCAGMDLRVGKA